MGETLIQNPKAAGAPHHDAPVLIDYYKMLALPADAAEADIRQRLGTLYLKAQQNLDHRNHRKRFYYHELYEVHIPQARVFLLDAQKRACYDRFLAGQRGQNSRQEWKSVPRVPAEDQNVLREIAYLPATQTESAAAFAGNAIPAISVVATGGGAPAAAMAAFSSTGVLSPPAAAPRRVVRRSQPAPVDPAVDRRRDDQRRELIKHELIFVGMRWGILSGLATVALCVLLLMIARALLPRGGASLGISGEFPLALALGMTVVSTLFARAAMRWARRRVVGLLSQMPYEELLRHCAH
jgi:hypothetical protein